MFRLRDRVASSYSDPSALGADLVGIIPAGIEVAITSADRIAIDNFLQHRFDLLGSGWVQVRPGMACRGFESIRFDAVAPLSAAGAARSPVARRARQMISPGYAPIDWQLDFKSGYRWSERTWYRDIRYGNVEGVDVKVPWELSRMQHLPEMALAYVASRDPRVTQEFCDQICDWIAENPPRFGVNWACTMDVGIRVANWVIASDLLRAAGARFDASFDRLLAAAVHDHAQHIARNLEWTETRRANHYLGNVAGLLLAATYLPSSPQSDAWLLFAIQEMQVETERQFLPDGGHFEGSTSYHRLCAEMIAVCAVFLNALPSSRIDGLLRAPTRAMPYGPGLRAATSQRLAANIDATGTVLSREFYSKLERAAELTRDLTRYDGSVPAIGDDDSGRFVRFGGWIECPSENGMCLEQAASNHQQWLAWAAALLQRSDLLETGQSHIWLPAKTLADALMRSSTRVERDDHTPANRNESVRQNTILPRAPTHRQSATYRAGGSDLLEGAEYVRYLDFGVYIVRSERLHLVIRCGAVHDGSGIHAHQDQLSFDLTIDGAAVTRDPGTYIYTPSRRWRNAYRSAGAHSAPCTRGQGASRDKPIFASLPHINGECLEFVAGKFVGRTTVDGGEVVRTIALYVDRIEVLDEYVLQPGWEPAVAQAFRPAAPVPPSPAYGVRLSA